MAKSEHGKLARRTFIAEAIVLPFALKLGLAFASEASDSHSSASRVAITTVRIAEFNDSGAPIGVATIAKAIKSDTEWRKQLTPEQYDVTREAGTEPPFTNEYDKLYTKGIYRCICCGTAWNKGDLDYQVGDADIVLTQNFVKYLVVETICKRPDSLVWHRPAV